MVNKVQLYYMIYYTAKNCILQFLKLIQESFFAVGCFEDKSPRIRWLRPQYERHLKLSCPAETTQWESVSSQQTKMLKLFWPLLILRSRTMGLIWRGATYCFQKTQLFSYLSILDVQSTRRLSDKRDGLLHKYHVDLPKHLSEILQKMCKCPKNVSRYIENPSQYIEVSRISVLKIKRF